MNNEVKTYDQFINENLKIRFKKEIDDENTTISAIIDKNIVGQLTLELLNDSYTYEFDDILTEDEFYEIFPDDEIIKISHIKVDDNSFNLGIGQALMNYGMNLMKNDGYTQFYLNASPMGFGGLNTENLVNFYKKFGFKI
jgi:ribosomal protein S18 acetylase RimI-like enzyme